MSLKLAVRAGLPLVSATTTDPTNLIEICQEITGKEVNLLPVMKAAFKPFPGKLYMVVGDKFISDPESMYRVMLGCKCSLIVINPSEQNPMYFDTGVLPTPDRFVYDKLSDDFTEAQYREIKPVIGGLTMKQIIEVIRLTQARDGSVSVQGVMRSRLEHMRNTQGLEIVNTDMPGYMPDAGLTNVAVQEKSFFLSDNIDWRIRMRGILADGPPGTGKSAGAKYLAREWGIPLFRLDATVQSRWVGESEGNLAAALKHLEQMAPCVLLIDEAEKMFADTNDTGVTAKLLGTLLWWMQEHRAKILTYITTNKMLNLPPELYREGRVDKVLKFKGTRRVHELGQEIARSLGADPDVARKELEELRLSCNGEAYQSAIAKTVIEQIKKGLLKGKKK